MRSDTFKWQKKTLDLILDNPKKIELEDMWNIYRRYPTLKHEVQSPDYIERMEEKWMRTYAECRYLIDGQYPDISKIIGEVYKG